jgi:hypothetical protein
MAVQYNSGSIATDGLVILVDPASVLSYAGSGTTLSNRVTGGINGTLDNGAAFTQSDGASYITTDGTNDLIRFVENAAYRFSGTDPFTIDAWIYPLAVGGYLRLINRESYIGGSLRDGYTTWFNLSGGTYYVGFERFGSGTSSGGSIAISNPIGKWNHCVFAYSGTQTKIYMGGVLLVTQSSTVSITNTNESLAFGGAISYGVYSNNRFGQIKVYNRELSATEVYHNYIALRGRYES